MMGKDRHIVVNYKERENECIDFEENKTPNKQRCLSNQFHIY